ncbi:MAG: hypothetical protein ACI9WL_001547, partial [Rubritalea sp.]
YGRAFLLQNVPLDKEQACKDTFLMDSLYFLFQPTRAPYRLPNHPSKKFTKRPEKK